jgi:hypothetical protein
MTRIRAILTLLRRGHAVADPAAWKRRHITVAALAGLLVAISQALEAFGYGHFFPVNAESAAVLAAAVLVIADLFLVPATTDKVGLPTVGDDPPAESPKPATRNDRPAQDEHYLG